MPQVPRVGDLADEAQWRSREQAPVDPTAGNCNRQSRTGHCRQDCPCGSREFDAVRDDCGDHQPQRDNAANFDPEARGSLPLPSGFVHGQCNARAEFPGPRWQQVERRHRVMARHDASEDK